MGTLKRGEGFFVAVAGHTDVGVASLLAYSVSPRWISGGGVCHMGIEYGCSAQRLLGTQIDLGSMREHSAAGDLNNKIECAAGIAIARTMLVRNWYICDSQ